MFSDGVGSIGNYADVVDSVVCYNAGSTNAGLGMGALLVLRSCTGTEGDSGFLRSTTVKVAVFVFHSNDWESLSWRSGRVRLVWLLG